MDTKMVLMNRYDSNDGVRWNLGPVSHTQTHEYRQVYKASFITWFEHSFTVHFLSPSLFIFVETLLFLAHIMQCPFILIIFIGRVNDRLVVYLLHTNQPTNQPTNESASRITIQLER